MLKYNEDSILKQLHNWAQFKKGGAPLGDLKDLDSVSKMVFMDSLYGWNNIKPSSNMEYIRYISSKYYDGRKLDYKLKNIDPIDLLYASKNTPVRDEHFLPWITLNFHQQHNFPEDKITIKAINCESITQQLIMWQNDGKYIDLIKRIKDIDIFCVFQLLKSETQFSYKIFSELFKEEERITILKTLNKYQSINFENTNSYGIFNLLEDNTKKELWFNAPLMVVANTFQSLPNTSRLGLIDRIINSDEFGQMNSNNKKEAVKSMLQLRHPTFIDSPIESYFLESLHHENKYKKIWNIAKSLDLNTDGFINLFLANIKPEQAPVFGELDFNNS